jgi:hypothetical protein
MVNGFVVMVIPAVFYQKCYLFSEAESVFRRIH